MVYTSSFAQSSYSNFLYYLQILKKHIDNNFLKSRSYARDYQIIVGLNPPTGVDRQHESREAQSIYPSALQLARALRLEFVGRAT
jgi:hypothetical protein